MRAVIRPGDAFGTAAAPPSKSMAHRLLICAGLAAGESLIRGVAPSQDILATADCLTALGAKLDWKGNDVRVTGCDPRRASLARLICRESGSTLRFFLPLCLLSGANMTLAGSPVLLGRPLSIYEDICRDQGLRFENSGEEITVSGRLVPGEYALPGNVSSQFISGLLFALPLLAEDSVLRLIPPVESRPYLDMTLDALRRFGVEIRKKDEYTLAVPGGAVYQPREEEVEGDYSNAAFLEAFNCLGGRVRVTGLRENSLQGDRVYREYFARLAQGSCTLDVTDCPDLAPVLLAVAAACRGGRLTGTRRLRFKESDRGTAMARELEKLGACVTLEENDITVAGGSLRAPSEPLSSHNDHRVAMALSLLCARVGGAIEGAEAVNKSFPGYWETLKELNVKVELYGVDQQ